MPSRHKGKVEIELYSYSTPTLEGNRQPPGHVNPGKETGTHWAGSWVVLGASVYGSVKSRPHRRSNAGQPNL